MTEKTTVSREALRATVQAHRADLDDPVRSRVKSDQFYRDLMRNARREYPRQVGCGCECCFGGFCGGCGHAGCGGR
jgi:hypothetical protein